MNVQVVEFKRKTERLDVSVVQRRNETGAWSVEAIADDEDGSIYQAQFHGPNAEDRAREYASFKYGV